MPAANLRLKGWPRGTIYSLLRAANSKHTPWSARRGSPGAAKGSSLATDRAVVRRARAFRASSHQLSLLAHFVGASEQRGRQLRANAELPLISYRG